LPDELAISVATIAELHFGVLVAKDAHAVKSGGRNPRGRVMDLWIAATAMTRQLSLYTRNPADFVGLEELVEVRGV
jgi:predicted nucleic acid-binding protein